MATTQTPQRRARVSSAAISERLGRARAFSDAEVRRMERWLQCASWGRETACQSNEGDVM
jgi:hypothetical protein